jgi:hypothetical protein
MDQCERDALMRKGRPPNPLRIANMQAHAEAILIDVSREFNIDVPSLKSPARFGHFMPPRREYARRCVEAMIGCTVAAPVIGRHHTSFREYVCERRQAYKRAIYRRGQC